MSGKTVVEVTEVLVEPPLVDGAPAFVRLSGLFSELTKALEWLSAELRHRGPNNGGLRYYVVNMIVVDEQPIRMIASLIQGGDDTRRGMIAGDIKTPWEGRAPTDCKYRPGDLVGFVHSGVYRIGTVLALPPSPEEARRRGGVTLGDNAYLVGLLDKRGSPETTDHERVSGPLLFSVEHELPEAFRAALKATFQGYVP